MQKTKVFFIDLAVSNKIRHTCEVVEKLYQDGFSITVFTANSSQKHAIDRMLWTWKQESFIPHTSEINPSSTMDEPVIITDEQNIPIQTDALVQFDPLPMEKLPAYKLVVDFAEVYDNARLLKSRERYKRIRDNGNFELSYLKLGEFLGSALFSS